MSIDERIRHLETVESTGAGVALPHNLLSATHADSVVNAATRGSLIYGNATTLWDELVLGGISGSILTRDATDVLWSAFALAGTAGQTYTFPAASGSVPTGTGTAGRVVQWVTASTIEDSNLIGPATNVLTLAATVAATLTVPETMTSAGRDTAQTFTAANVFQNAVNSTGALVVNNAAAVAVLVVDTTNGRVGIGTPGPEMPLHVIGDGLNAGSIRIDNTNAGATLVANRTDGVAANIHAGPSTGRFIFLSDGDFRISANISRSEILSGTNTGPNLNDCLTVLGSNGNVGINFTTPTAQLQVHSSSATTITQILRAAALQSANLTEWQTAGGVLGLAVDKDFIIRATSQRTGAGVLAMLNLTGLGSGSDGDGAAVYMRGSSSTTAAQDMARMEWLWDDATHASRTSDLVLKTVLNGVLQEHLRLPGVGKYTMTLGGAYTLTVPATGTAALLERAQTFTAANIFQNAVNSTGALVVNNAAGTRVLTVDTTNLWVGVSPDLPVFPLDVKAAGVAVTIDGNANYRDIMGFRDSGGRGATIGANTTDGVAFMRTNFVDNDLVFCTRFNPGTGNANLERTRIKANGNVLIGTTTDSARLTVQGGADTAQLLVTGHTTQAVATPIAQITRNDTAAGVAAMFALTGLGSGANGDGVYQEFAAASSTTAAQTQGRIATLWNDATHASRKADLVLSAFDTAEREGIRIRGAGSAAGLGFYGVTPVTRQVLATGGGATVDQVITALQNLGLLSQT